MSKRAPDSHVAWLQAEQERSLRETEIRKALRDLPEEANKKLRRRVEDCLRKSPKWLLSVASVLAATDQITYKDLIE